MHTIRRPWACVVLGVVLLASAAGCDHTGPAARFDDYLARLARTLDEELPAPFVAYRRNTLAAGTGVWATLDDAIARHTRLWQKALGQCNLTPGS